MDKIDILNRKEFIDRIVGLIETTANYRGHRSFAIDGEWGAGKTWVLEEIENKLTTMEIVEGCCPFLVIHYNCWEYDYYQEPLFAIASALLNFVENTKILKSRTKGALKKGLKQIFEKLLSTTCTLAKPYVGFDIKKMLESFKGVIDETGQDERTKFNFDVFYDFKGILAELKAELAQLSKRYSIVFCVDELDRCLPKYAIKVLERLHHVFDEIENLQVLLAVDKEQLEETVKSIFGGNVNVTGYLAKFIDFTIVLPLGKLNCANFEVLFNDYIKGFTGAYGHCLRENWNEFFEDIFAYTSVRRRIKIIEKAKLVHSLMPQKSLFMNVDSLAVEVLLTMTSFIYDDLNVQMNKPVNSFYEIINLNDEREKELWIIKQKVFNETTSKGRTRFVAPHEDRDYFLIDVEDIWGLLYAVLIQQYPFFAPKYHRKYEHPSNLYFYKLLFSHAKTFFEILKLIS